MFFSVPIFTWNLFPLVGGCSDLAWVLELFLGCANIFNPAPPDCCEGDTQKMQSLGGISHFIPRRRQRLRMKKM